MLGRVPVEPLDRLPHRLHALGEPDLPERAHAVRPEVQAAADADAAGIGGLLDHLDVDAGARERDRRREPADAGADDEGLRHTGGVGGAISPPTT